MKARLEGFFRTIGAGTMLAKFIRGPASEATQTLGQGSAKVILFTERAKVRLVIPCRPSGRRHTHGEYYFRNMERTPQSRNDFALATGSLTVATSETRLSLRFSRIFGC